MGNDSQNMFTIDLLKGRGTPIKGGPWGIAITAITVTVPLVVAIVMFGFYLNRKIIVSIRRQEVTRCQAEINKLSSAVERQNAYVQEKIIYNNCLSEVKSSLGRYIQWSPVLMTLVENMPDSMTLTGLEIKEHFVRRKIPKKDNPQKLVDTNVPVQVLRMSVSGSSERNCDEAVREFRDSLRSSAALGPNLENIVVSQESGTLEGQDIASYEIDCVFKPRL